ncbi:MAG: Na+/H+ antiporter NhaA [Acidimicrobiia bacterium]|nr:Na+/H+ antiporter NhaA [Acidimicrobiia bacterium]
MARPILPFRRVGEFLRTESAGGVVLMLATVTAIAWANLAPSSYTTTWTQHLSLPGPDHALSLSAWVNEGLMAIFFFVVGLEIKREVVDGELRDPRTASVPVAAAIGGMVFPALIFLIVTAGTDFGKGWGIPMATDIAFAIGILRIFGTRAPSGVGLTLLTLAIVDDLGAIAVIAIFYSHGFSLPALLGAIGVGGVAIVMRRFADHPAWYILPAVILWLLVLRSGLHATIAGVMLGFLTPVRTRSGRDVLASLEHALHPWSSFVVLPLFALANAGIVISGDRIADAARSPLAIGIGLGLVVGKVAGIGAGVFIATRLGGRLPPGVGPREVLTIGLLGGIGFTVSLFVAALAFNGTPLDIAKLAILVTSIAAAIAAAGMLRTIPSETDAPA